jgi:hypothetical protein
LTACLLLLRVAFLWNTKSLSELDQQLLHHWREGDLSSFSIYFFSINYMCLKVYFLFSTFSV